MATRQIKPEGDGVFTDELSSFADLQDAVDQLHRIPGARSTGPRTLIYRGQRNSWKLLPKLARGAGRQNSTTYAKYEIEQRRRYRLATRGQMDRLVPDSAGDDEWWAVGQHHGLATPLLDWTESPYVALFFAFCEPEEKPEDRRVVYALHWSALEDGYVLPNGTPTRRLASVVTPERSRDERMIVQQGLFLKPVEYTRDIESLVREAYLGQGGEYLCLAKITFAGSVKRADVLRRLKSMNITYRTLFPDLEGAAKHCNLALEIENY